MCIPLNLALARHLVSEERLPFTATYFGSIGLTLYFAVGVSCSNPSEFHGSTATQLHTTTHRYTHNNIFVLDGVDHAAALHTCRSAEPLQDPASHPVCTIYIARASFSLPHPTFTLLTLQYLIDDRLLVITAVQDHR